jgi:hypothetical protein
MENIKTARILSIIVIIGGAIVMAGWILDIEVLKSILPVWVTMKFSTALSFFLSGITLYFVTSFFEKRADLVQIALSLTTLMILLLMATLLVSTFLDVRTGVEDLFVRETEDAVKTTTPGRPSVGTMINFILVAIAGILTLFDMKKLGQKIYVIGSIILVIGSLAVLGYVLSMPFLYYTVEGFSTAMALHTAILFIITGAGFSLFRKRTV